MILLVSYLKHIVVYFSDNLYGNIIRSDFQVLYIME